MDSIICRSCGKDDFKDYTELAVHILSSSKKTHKHGRIWAAKYSNRKTLSKRIFGEYQPITDEQREAKEDTRRELSGETKLVPTRCPRCKTGSRQMIEVEHANNPEALRIDNYFVILCEGCR